METRKQELLKLRSQINEIDTEFSTILQSLQWDRKHLLEDRPKVICKYNAHHRVLQESAEIHETQCRFALNGYSKEEKLLPDPPDNNAKTLIQLSKDDIKQIITQAANASANPSLIKVFHIIIIDAAVAACSFDINVDIEPQTLDRLQSTYTGDERRAIYDAVVQAASFCHDLSDLALPSVPGQDETTRKQKSRLEILAELRNMKRRRTKYRVAAKTRNYSDVLRDVIKTQMEMYSDVKTEKTNEAITPSGILQVALKSEPSPPPPRNEMLRPRVYNDNHYQHKRNNYNEDRHASSRKSRHNDKTDSRTRHKDYRDRRYDDYEGGRNRHSNRDSDRYEERYSDKRNKEKTKYRNHDKYEDSRRNEIKKENDVYERETNYSCRDLKEEQQEATNYNSGYDYESRKRYSNDESSKEIKKEREKEKSHSSKARPNKRDNERKRRI